MNQILCYSEQQLVLFSLLFCALPTVSSPDFLFCSRTLLCSLFLCQFISLMTFSSEPIRSVLVRRITAFTSVSFGCTHSDYYTLQSKIECNKDCLFFRENHPSTSPPMRRYLRFVAEHIGEGGPVSASDVQYLVRRHLIESIDE